VTFPDPVPCNPVLWNRENCDLSKVRFAPEQERKKNDLKKEEKTTGLLVDIVLFWIYSFSQKVT